MSTLFCPYRLALYNIVEVSSKRSFHTAASALREILQEGMVESLIQFSMTRYADHLTYNI